MDCCFLREHPVAHRRDKSGLTSSEYLGRKRELWCTCHRSLVQARKLAHKAAYFLPKSPVYEWHPDFERVTHARPIRVTQQLIPHVPHGFEGRDLRERVFGSGC